MNKLQGELLALTDPAVHGLAVHGARDAKQIADTEVRIRGEAEKLGPKVPRGFLTAFDVPDSPSMQSHAAEWPAGTGALADEPAQPAHAAGDCEPRLVPPVRAGNRFDGRQFRHDGRRANESGTARPSRDAVRSGRVVDQAVGAHDRTEPDVSTRLPRPARRTRPSIRPTHWSGGTAPGGSMRRRSATRCSRLRAG